MPNRLELRLMIGEEVGIVAPGEVMSADDSDYIKRREESKLAELYEAGLISFDQDGDIPEAYMLPIAKIIAGEVAPGFGSDIATAKALASEGLATLRKLKAPPYFPTAPATYY